MRDDKTESANGAPASVDAEQGHGRSPEGKHGTPADGSTPAPEREVVDTSGLTFVENGRVWIFDNEGEGLASYEQAGNYFKALKAQLTKEEDKHGFLELNERGANYWIQKDEGLMDVWDSCRKLI